MTKQFAPMSNVKREPTGEYRRALIGPKWGKVGEVVTRHNWGGVSLRFPHGDVLTYADSDTEAVIVCSECDSVIYGRAEEHPDGRPLCGDCYGRLYSARDVEDARYVDGDRHLDQAREAGRRW